MVIIMLYRLVLFLIVCWSFTHTLLVVVFVVVVYVAACIIARPLGFDFPVCKSYVAYL